MLAESLDDFCPSCGKSRTLNSVSGFCIPCTKEAFPNKAVCSTCGRVEDRGQFRTKCQICQEEEWYEQNANRIESYMAVGLTFRMAVIKVQFDNRPSCLSCGKKIKGGTRGRHFFCRTSKECRSARVKFKHLKEKGLTKSEAIQETVRWIKTKERNVES